MTFSTDALIPPHASNPRIVKLDCFVSNPRKAACSAWVANRRQMCTTRNGAHAISCKFLGGPALYNATGMVLTTPTPIGRAPQGPSDLMMMAPEAAEMPRRAVGRRGAG